MYFWTMRRFVKWPALILGLLCLSGSACRNKETLPDNLIGPPVYSVVFSAQICPPESQPDCFDGTGSLPVAGVRLWLFESETARELGQKVIVEGTSNATGNMTFSGLSARDYFYTAEYPDPDAVAEPVLKHFIRISPNTSHLEESILFIGK
ncbi:MAG: hypothetical protein D6714_13540 [Bacteroidetes bacterium]|nr:MAG: hypothetical protein D6714_13540 [Bacteroidota bacterium]